MTAAGTTLSALGTDALAAPEAKPACKIIGFSKPFQTDGPAETADIVAEVGWDGIECPVRPKGQIPRPSASRRSCPKWSRPSRKWDAR